MASFKVMARGLFSCWDKPPLYAGVEDLVGLMRKTLDGYRDGDLVRQAWVEIIDNTNYVHCGDDSHERPCYESIYRDLFRKYNTDDRPDGQTERSMCIGDCIQFVRDEGDVRTFTIYQNRFIEVDNPSNVYVG